MSGTFGVPDILSTSRLARSQADIKQRLTDAQTEMTTGEAVDRHRATGGDVSRIMALDRSVSTLDSRVPLLAMARSRAEGTQNALESIQTSTDQMGVKLLRDISAGDLSSAKLTAKDARTALGQVLGALNVQLSGRHLFAGAQTGAPMPQPETLLADVEAVVALSETEQLTAVDGKTLAQRIEANLGLYFTKGSTIDVDPTAGIDERSFDALFAGGQDPPDAPPVELADGEHLHYAVRGDADALRAMIRGLSAASVAVSRFTAAADGETLTAMLDTNGSRILSATDAITKMRTELGLAENRIDEAQTATTAQRAALERARAGLVGVDPYDAATRVSELETQLQAIYAMTARSSQLSLLNFLR